LSQETARLILPFATLASNRIEAFLDETEKAAVFCLAELERAKGGGIIAKHPPEKTNFISKIHYPLWLFPFHETNLIFDGLKRNSLTLPYPSIQDIQAFMDGVDRSSSSRQAYQAFLIDNTNYFQISSQEEKKQTVEGLIADENFQHDFNSYLSEAESLNASSPEMAVLPPTINEAFIISATDELESLRIKFSNEVNLLNKSMKLLNATTKGFVETIQQEIKEVKATFEKELEKRRGPVEEQVKEIRRKCDTEITLASKSFEKELLKLQKEKVKHENARDQLSRKIAYAEAEVKTSAAKKNDAEERRWKEEKKKRKKEHSNAESEIKKVEKQIKDTEDKKASELFRIRSERDAKIQEATKELVEIESSRDAKVQVLMQETEKIKGLTAEIIKQIDTASKLRESSLTAFEKYGIAKKYNRTTLVYMPFYLVCFQSGTRKRYVHFPPSTVSNVKLSVKLKGALGMAKIKQLFSPRSNALVSLLNKLLLMLEENAVLEREVGEDAAKSDLLRAKDAVESIRSGLTRLKEEGWLSEKEYEAFGHELK
jgi:hypothetical protein